MAGVVVAWSGGKDCAVALRELRADGVDVEALFTTVNRRYDRSTMHGVRRVLHERQADALGLPLDVVELPAEPSNEAYEEAMARRLNAYRERGVEAVAFADLFLEDVRAYREDRLAGTGLAGRWPLWGRDTGELARAFLDAGFRALVVAADADVFGPSAAGRPYDEAFLADLPPGVDPCGERGAFHTFVTDGPGFDAPVAVEVGATETRPVGDGAFHYADLRPADA